MSPFLFAELTLIWSLSWSPVKILGWRNRWCSVCALSMWQWSSPSVPVGSLPHSPCYCTGRRWRLAPHFHGMPAEGKCVHLASFVFSLAPNPRWIILLSVYQAKGHGAICIREAEQGSASVDNHGSAWASVRCVQQRGESKRKRRIREKPGLFSG